MNRPNLYLQNGQLDMFRTLEYIGKLEKALDKACWLIEQIIKYTPMKYIPKDIDVFNGGHIKDKDEWKNEFLQAVSEGLEDE